MRHRSDYDYVLNPSPLSGIAVVVAYELPEQSAPINDELIAETVLTRGRWMSRVLSWTKLFRRWADRRVESDPAA